jgi:hypothetical protein
MNKLVDNQPGINFCPQCGCNVGLIKRALELSLPQIPKSRVEREPEPPKPKLSSAEIVKKVEEGKSRGRKLKEIADEIGIQVGSFYYHKEKVRRDKMQAALTARSRPKTAPKSEDGKEVAA